MVVWSALLRSSLLLVALGGVGSCVREESFDRRLARANCDLAVDCGDYPNVRTCMEVTYAEQAETYVDLAIDAGRIDYDRAQAYRCVRATRKLKCYRGEDRSEAEEDCQRVLSGLVEPEEPCNLALECAGELSLCGFEPGCTDACCPGRCRFIPGSLTLGEPCAQDPQCEAGAYCELNGAGGAGVCAAFPRLGEACELTNYGTSDNCAGDTFCNEEGVCEGRRPPLSLCSDDDECERRSRCSAGACVERSKKGGPCGVDRDCLHGDHVCDLGVCSEPAALGDFCALSTRPCAGYAVCAEGQCTELGRVGDSCSEMIPCYPALRCDEDTCVKDGPVEMDLCPIPL